MKTRKFLSLALAFVMVFALVPAASLAAEFDALARETAQLHKLDKVWAVLDTVEAVELAAGSDRTAVINAVYEAALNNEDVDKDSFSDFTKDGFFFTVDGMYCAYNYKLRNEIDRSGQGGGQTVITPSNGKNVPLRDATSPNVLLVGPYYGQDGNFTNQYLNEANSIAAVTGGTMTKISGTNATGPAIAANYPDKGVVIYDSHGSQSGDSSYLCLTTDAGITSEDYNNGWAVNAGWGEAWIDGRYILHHITGELANPLVWMAICEGMKKSGKGTTGTALLNAGAGAVYGYSQSVTFVGDYAYEATFWSHMKQGETVAEAYSTMVAEHSIPDPYGDAYPIVMSEVDPFPANPDGAQTVNCEWTLFGNAEPVALTGFWLNPADIEMFVGRTAEINFIREPANANAYELAWTSSDESVAAVEGSKNKRKATVTGMGEGDAVITCTVTAEGELFGTADVPVSVTVNPLFAGLSAALNVEGGTLQFGTSEPYGFEPHEEEGRTYARSTNWHGATDSTAELTAAIKMKAGETLSFDYFYSTQAEHDWYDFSVNGEQIQHLSGEANSSWNNYMYTAPSDGVYSFVWSYSKDKSTSARIDRVRIDNVSYSGSGSETVIADGDVDLQDGVTVSDALLALRYSMGIIELTDEQIAHGDVSGDGRLTAEDAVLILRIAMNIA